MNELTKSTKSLETTRRAQELLPTFYRKQAPNKAGGALAWCMVGVSPEILYAFDLPAEWPENFGTLCAAKNVASDFIEQAEADGYSPDLCSYVRNTMGYTSKMLEIGGIPPGSPKGGMGAPTMLLGSGSGCDPRYKWFQSLSSRYLHIPVFHTDPMSPPHDTDVSDPRVRAHYSQQLRESIAEQIEFITKHAGRSIDLDRLRDAITIAQEQDKLAWEIYNLRAAVPCPMGAEDFFTGCVIPLRLMTGELEAVEYMRRLRDEVKGRVERGIGVLENERYRLLWVGIPPWYNLGFFNAIGALGGVFPVNTVYFSGPPVEIDLKDPVEALVERAWKRSELSNSWGTEIYPENVGPCDPSRPGTRLIREWVKKFKLDGAIMHRTRSCRAVSWGQVHIKNLLAEEGIPSLIIESDMGDPRSWNQSAMMAQVRGLLSTIDSARRASAQA